MLDPDTNQARKRGAEGGWGLGGLSQSLVRLHVAFAWPWP